MSTPVELISPRRISKAIQGGNWRDFTDAELLAAVLALREWEQRQDGPIKTVVDGLAVKAMNPEDSQQAYEVADAISSLMDDVAIRDLAILRMAPAAIPVGDRHAIWRARDVGAQVLAVAGGHGVAAFRAEPAPEHGLVFDRSGQLMLQRLNVEAAYPYLDGFALPRGSAHCDDLVDVVSVYGDRYLISKADFLDLDKTMISLRDQLGHKLWHNEVRPERVEVLPLHRGNIAAVRDVEFHDDVAVVYGAPWAQRILETEATLGEQWLDIRDHAIDLERDLMDPYRCPGFGPTPAAEVLLDGTINRPMMIAGVKVDCLADPGAASDLRIGSGDGTVAVEVREGMASAVEAAIMASARRKVLDYPAGMALPRVKALSWPLHGDHVEIVGVYDSLGQASKDARPGFAGAPLRFVDESGVRLGEALAHRDTDAGGIMPETKPRTFAWEQAGLERLAVEAASVVAPSVPSVEFEELSDMEP